MGHRPASVVPCSYCAYPMPPNARRRGLCTACYQRWRAYGDPAYRRQLRERVITPPTCPDCGTTEGLRAEGCCAACAIRRALGA